MREDHLPIDDDERSRQLHRIPDDRLHFVSLLVRRDSCGDDFGIEENLP